MALKADRDGFLVGEGEGVRFRSAADAYGVLKGIKSDTSAIVSMLRSARVRPTVTRIDSRIPDAVSRPRRAAVQEAVTPAGARTSQRVTRGIAGGAATPQRDSHGRFIASAKPEPAPKDPDLSANQDPDEPESRKRTSRIAEAIKSGVKDAVNAGTGGTEQVDPMLMAAKEMKDTIAPITSAVGTIGGAILGSKEDREEKRQAKANAKEQEKRNLPWYKRFEKRLKAIAEPDLSGSGGFLKDLIVTMIGRVFSPFISLGTTLKGIAGLGPILGRLALPIAGMLSAVKSFNTSTEEYAKRLGIELNGSLAQELGVRFVGVLGDLGNTLTFGLAGKFGEWLSTQSINVIDAGARFKNKVVTGASDRWSSVKSFFTGSHDANKARLEAEAAKAGIKDPNELAAFLAQTHHESGGFRELEESFGYTPDRLLEVSAAARSKGRDAAVRAVRAGPRAVAELMYGGRMGNTEAGDGYKYRGRGFIQLTGRAQYAEASKALDIDLINNPDLASDPDIAARIAVWYWGKSRAGAHARAGNVSSTTKAINGGYNGLAQRGALTDAYAAMNAPASGAAPGADKFWVPKLELPPQRLNSKDDKPVVNVTIPVPITQNVSDRGIANVATGGMGGKGDSM